MTIQELITSLSACPPASKIIFNDDDKNRLLKIDSIDPRHIDEMPELCDRPPLGDIVIIHLGAGSELKGTGAFPSSPAGGSNHAQIIMKDSTKRVIATEIKFFFKWMCVGIGGSLLSLLLFFINGYLLHILPEDVFEAGFVFCPIILPISLYVFRFIRAAVKWVKKYAD